MLWASRSTPRAAPGGYEEEAYRQNSTVEECRKTGWIGGQSGDVMLDRALRHAQGGASVT